MNAVQCRLAYIIPGDSRKGLAFARQVSVECREKGIAGVVLVPWAETDEVKGYEGEKVSIPKEAMLHDVLRRNCFGETSPADPGAVEIARVLRNAALKNFDYKHQRLQCTGSSQTITHSRTVSMRLSSYFSSA